MLCSLHFEKSYIDFRDKIGRLRKGSIPTIFNHEKKNEVSTTRKKIEDNNDTSELISRRPLTDHSSIQNKATNSRSSDWTLPIQEQELISNQPYRPAAITNMENQGKVPDINVIAHDHVYIESPDIVKRKLDAALATVKRLSNQNKALNQREKRARKTNNAFKDIRAQLRESNSS